MKRLLLIIAVLIPVMAFSKGNPLADKGYMGNVSVEVTPDPSLVIGCNFTTSHGYSFGDGLWMGGGTGVFTGAEYDGIWLPFTAEVKYSFINSYEKCSPFMGCKAGYVTNIESTFSFISLTGGIDINSMSVFVSYESWAVKTINLGVSYNF